MMMQMLVHQILFILLFSICGASTAPLMGKPGCQPKCGKINIPYPFGIGPNRSCYYDEWFRIDCNKSTKGKPFLRLAKLEVRNISIKGTIQVYNPVTFFCEDYKRTPVSNLSQSPFVYSQNHNIFTALCCDNLAGMSSADFTVGGCRSACDHKSQEWNCDMGVNCCQTSIPPYLTLIEAELYNVSTDCNKFAFLVEKDWFVNNSNKSISDFTASMKSMLKVPVALDWRINNDTLPFEFFNNLTVDEYQYLQDVEKFGSYGLYGNLSTPSCKIDTSPVGNRLEIVCSCRRGFDGNPYLGEYSCNDIDECQDHQRCFKGRCVNEYGWFRCEDDDKRKAKLILATGLSSSLGLLLLLVGVWFGYKFLKKRNEKKRRQMFFKRNGGLLLEQQLSSGEVNVEKIKLFKSQELEKSTDNFNVDRILGHGGQGTVYKGMLEDGRIVAVKKAKMVDESQLSEFINEVVILSQINHRNVVQLLGCCLETEVPLLVYEYIPNGTLSKYITQQVEDISLTWKMRLRIATEIAGALSYLHSTASFPIYHRLSVS